MELPQELKALYRHWPGHTCARKAGSSNEVFADPQLFLDISAFVSERMRIWEKKYLGQPAPFTTDPILGEYRFCNILRELDRQTIEFHTLLNPLREDFPLWLLNMFYCRMVARPETVRGVGLLSFNTEENEALYKRLLAHPKPRYGTPYVFPISVIMRSDTPTRELFITQHLPRVMEDIAKEVWRWGKISVVEGVKKVLPIFGFNLQFLWTEVLIDVAYQFPEHIDLFKKFPVGPGALPTFGRIDPNVEPALLAQQLGGMSFSSGITYEGRPIILSAENWEGIGCEFRKYTNLSAGHGRRRLFSPKTGGI
jgi:hypothetical protein